jgi:hypothetical protein
MGFAPLPDPLHVLSVAEVISIAWFSEPAPLTGSFAGLAAIRSQTEKLTARIMNVRSEKGLTAATPASIGLGTHRPPNGKKTQPSNQSKTVREEEKKRRRKKSSREDS